jgi:aminopeptidase N
MLVIGLTDEVNHWLQRHGLPPRPAALTRGTAAAWTLAAQGQSIALVAASDAPSLAALVRPLPHYGSRSYVLFEGAKAIEMGVWPARPQTRSFLPPP